MLALEGEGKGNCHTQSVSRCREQELVHNQQHDSGKE